MVQRRRYFEWYAIGALIGVTALVYAQVGWFGFVHFDDETYVFENPAVLKGLSLEGVQWAFTHGVSGHWHPLTMMSHMLDVSLYGVKFPGGHHLTSLALHLANVALVYILFRKLLGDRKRSGNASGQRLARSASDGSGDNPTLQSSAAAAGSSGTSSSDPSSPALRAKPAWEFLSRPQAQCLFIAALFALHPIHVESVAWISIRKDVLSQFFGLLSLIAYVDYARRKRGQAPFPALRYLLVLVFFALGLMSKAVLVTLPMSMLLLDFWPLRRCEAEMPEDELSTPVGRIWARNVLICVVEKLPFLGLTAIASWLTVRFMTMGHVISDLSALPGSLRFENGVVSYVIYLRKLILPLDLGVQYRYPEFIPAWQWAGAIVILGLITGIVFHQVLRRPWLVVGWLWFVGTVFPVSGVMQAGMQPMADRYAYLSFLGLYLILAMLGAWTIERLAARANIIWAIAAAVGIAMTVITFIQIGTWRDTNVMFSRAVALDPMNPLALGGLGNDLANRHGDYEHGIPALRRAVEILPGAFRIRYNLAFALGKVNEVDDAVDQLHAVIRTEPRYVEAYILLTAILANHKRFSEALEAIDMGLKIEPGNARLEEMREKIRQVM